LGVLLTFASACSLTGCSSPLADGAASTTDARTSPATTQPDECRPIRSVVPSNDRAVPTPPSAACVVVVLPTDERFYLQVVPASASGASDGVAWLDVGGPGINATTWTGASLPPWLRSYTVVLPVERWVHHPPSAACSAAMAQHVGAVLDVHTAPAAAAAAGCADSRPWSRGDYADALRRTAREVGGLSVVVGSSFGGTRVGAIAADLDRSPPPQVVLTDPAPPAGTPLAVVAGLREQGVLNRLGAVGACTVPCTTPDPRLVRGPRERLATLWASYTEQGLRDLVSALAGPDPAFDAFVEANADQATFRYGTGQTAPGLVGFTQELCGSYPAGDADTSGVPGYGPFASTLVALIGTCAREGPEPAAPLPDGTCVVTNPDDPVSGDATSWARLSANAHTVSPTAGPDHGASLAHAAESCVLVNSHTGPTAHQP
jgi:hypothetical protein